MKNLFLLFLLSSCHKPEAEVIPCTSLFGAPSQNTGLGDGECGPACDCGEMPFTPPSYSEEDLQALEDALLASPLDVLGEDPYAASNPPLPDETQVCGVIGPPEAYSLQSFPSEEAAAQAGAQITHKGACGQCSPLQNLAVYMRNTDLTDPVRDCGMKGMFEGDEANLQCLEEIGFDPACAQIWFFNTRHTREVCLDVCLANLDATHHNSDGSLNDCIQCDEDESGPVFKAISGRTRRNSGLPSGLCRPCDSVYPVEHRYF